MKIYLILFLTFFYISINAQTYEDYFEKIDIKLAQDKSYLNLHYIDIDVNQLEDNQLSLPRISKDEPFNFLENESVSYRLVFLLEGIGIDSLNLLYIDEIRQPEAEGGGLFGGVGAGGPDTSIVMKYRDMFNLKMVYPEKYFKFYNQVEKFLRVSDVEPGKLFSIQVDDNIKTSLGLTSIDNTDFINFVKTSSPHYYPLKNKNDAIGVAARGRNQQTADVSYRFEASLSRLTFMHKAMELDIGTSSLELSVEEKIMNALPYHSSSIQGGFRILFALSDEDDIRKAPFLDTKFMARINLNTISLAESLPFIFSFDDPKLNFGTSLIGDFRVTRISGLPFMNLYFSVGDNAYGNPAALLDDPENSNNKIAYWTFQQAEGSFSFYWNNNDDYTIRFRMDVGAGYYNIYKANYTLQGAIKNYKSIETDIQPMVAVYLTWVPKDAAIIGGHIRFFDSALRFNAWLNVFKAGPHGVRFETQFLSQPFGRKMNPWEYEGGAFFQVKYRYGLD